MLDKILFWVVLVWMVGLLIMGYVAVREIWREASRPPADPDNPVPPSPDSGAAKPAGKTEAP
jgi:hypothetical protein